VVIVDRSIRKIRSFKDKGQSEQSEDTSVFVDLRTMILRESEGFEIPVYVTGDITCAVSDNLRTVFSNIIGNAVQHSGSDRIEITLEIEHDYCTVRIRDYGKGIAPEIEKRIFEEGFGFGPSAGTGMGLFFAKTILERYGGSITFQRGIPTGSIFEIELPIN